MESTSLTTPVGLLSVVADDEGHVTAAGFCAVSDLEARLRQESTGRKDLGDISKVVAAYFDGDITAIDNLPVAQPGTELQQQVWAALREIPAGSTTSYGALATELGKPVGASRAIGSACGRNLIAPFVPCHRVVQSGGGLGGYYYGLPVKRWLLDHERRAAVPG